MKKITIRNFGPIKNIEDLELSDFLIFIGPQASGKSTIVKSIHFFKVFKEYILDYILDLFENKLSREETLPTELPQTNEPSSTYEKSWNIQPLLNHLGTTFWGFWGRPFEKESYLKFQYQPEFFIELMDPEIHGYPTVMMSDAMRNNLEQHIADQIEVINKIKDAFFSTSLSYSEKVVKTSELNRMRVKTVEKLNEMFDEDSLLFIPAGRTLLVYEDLGLFDNKVHSDSITNEFIKQVLYFKPILDEKRKGAVDKSVNTRSTELSKLIQEKNKSILKGEYKRSKDEDLISIGEKLDVKLSQASSGQQESIWILFLLYAHILHNYQTSVVVEEPEAHLFPDSQKEMIDVIALFYNAFSKNRIMLTTHSPYILTSLNNLLYAFIAGQTNPLAVSKVVDKAYWINPKTFHAYFVNDGYITSIMGDGLVQSEKIDEISNTINQQFDQIFDAIHDNQNAPI